MPKTSRTTAPTVADHGPVVDRSADLEGYSVNFVSFAIDIDGAPLLKSLPDDRCACPRWGYVFKGSASFTFADRRRDLRGRRRLLRASGPHARPLGRLGDIDVQPERGARGDGGCNAPQHAGHDGRTRGLSPPSHLGGGTLPDRTCPHCP